MNKITKNIIVIAIVFTMLFNVLPTKIVYATDHVETPDEVIDEYAKVLQNTADEKYDLTTANQQNINITRELQNIDAKGIVSLIKIWAKYNSNRLGTYTTSTRTNCTYFRWRNTSVCAKSNNKRNFN